MSLLTCGRTSSEQAGRSHTTSRLTPRKTMRRARRSLGGSTRSRLRIRPSRPTCTPLRRPLHPVAPRWASSGLTTARLPPTSEAACRGSRRRPASTPTPRGRAPPSLVRCGAAPASRIGTWTDGVGRANTSLNYNQYWNKFGEYCTIGVTGGGPTKISEGYSSRALQPSIEGALGDTAGMEW